MIAILAIATVKKTPLWGLFCNVVSDVDDEDDYEYYEKVIVS